MSAREPGLLHAPKILGQLVEQLEYGPRRGDAFFYSTVAQCLSVDAAGVADAPATFFHFDSGTSGGGEQHPLDVPAIPLAAPASAASAKGWAAAFWLRLAPASRPAGHAEPRRTVKPTAALLAHFCGAAFGAEAEVWLSPTDVPQAYRLAVRSSSSGLNAGFRATKRSSTAEGILKLRAMHWHHVAISQTQPFLSMMKTPRVTVFVDGVAAFEQDLPCPPLPFVRASFGTGLDGDLAHVQLYAERLPYTHVAALYSRGPNCPTLHHGLCVPSPASAPPEVLRAGLVTAASLELLHDGLPMSGAMTTAKARKLQRAMAGGGGGNATGVSATNAASAAAAAAAASAVSPALSAVPRVLMLLDAAACVPAPPSSATAAAAGSLLLPFHTTTSTSNSSGAGRNSTGATSNSPHISSVPSPSPSPPPGASSSSSSQSSPRTGYYSSSAAAGGELELFPSVGASVSTLSGIVLDSSASVAQQQLQLLASANKGSLATSLTLLECPLWWSKGETLGPESATARKTLAAIIGTDLAISACVTAPAAAVDLPGGVPGWGSRVHRRGDAFTARLGPGVTVGRAASSAPGEWATITNSGGGGALLLSQSTQRTPRTPDGAPEQQHQQQLVSLPPLHATAYAWMAVGGVLRVLELARLCPLVLVPVAAVSSPGAAAEHANAPTTSGTGKDAFRYPAAAAAADSGALSARVLPPSRREGVLLAALRDDDGGDAARYLAHHPSSSASMCTVACGLLNLSDIAPSGAGAAMVTPGRESSNSARTSGNTSTGNSIPTEWRDPVAQLLVVLASLLRLGYHHREEMFQMRGFTVLGRLLSDRVATACRSALAIREGADANERAADVAMQQQPPQPLQRGGVAVSQQPQVDAARTQPIDAHIPAAAETRAAIALFAPAPRPKQQAGHDPSPGAVVGAELQLPPHLPPAIPSSTFRSAPVSRFPPISAAPPLPICHPAVPGAALEERRARLLRAATQWSLSHPINIAVWSATKEVLVASRAWGNEWGPLFLRGLRFLLCDWKLWTMPVDLQLLLHARTDGNTAPASAGATTGGGTGGPAAAAAAAAPSGRAAAIAAAAAAASPTAILQAPESSAPPSEHLAFFMHWYGTHVPVDPLVIAGWSSWLHEIAASAPLTFVSRSGMTVHAACDAFISSVRALATAMVHAQAKEQCEAGARWLQQQESSCGSTSTTSTATAAATPAAATSFSSRGEFPDPFSGMAPALRVPLAAGADSLPLLRHLLNETVVAWTRTLRLLLCLSFGAPVPMAASPAASTAAGGSGSSAPALSYVVLTEVEPSRAHADLAAVLNCFSVLAAEHRALQLQQEALLLSLHDVFTSTVADVHATAAPSSTSRAASSSSPSAAPAFTFVSLGKRAADPFAIACSSGIELLNLLLRSYPALFHAPLEANRGVFALTACLEAEHEGTRIAVCSVVSAVIALRRGMDPRRYGDDYSGNGNGGGAGVGAAAPPRGGARAGSSRRLELMAGSGRGGGSGSSSRNLLLLGGKAGEGMTTGGTDATGAESGNSNAAATAAAAGPTSSSSSSSFAPPTRATVLSAKEHQTRLLRVLWSALIDRPNTTTASAVAAMQIVLSPDLGGAGGSGQNAGSGGQGSRTNTAGGGGGGRGRSGTSGLAYVVDELLPSQSLASSASSLLMLGGGGSGAGSGANDPNGGSAADAPIRALDALDLCTPLSTFAGTSAAVTSALTSSSAAIIMRPDALPLVFMLLSQAGAALQRRYSRGTAAAAAAATSTTSALTSSAVTPTPSSLATLPVIVPPWVTASALGTSSFDSTAAAAAAGGGGVAPRSRRLGGAGSLLLLEQVERDAAEDLAIVAAECEGRMRIVLDFSLLVRGGKGGGGPNSMAVLRQAGWQTWLLDLMYLPKAPVVVSTPGACASGALLEVPIRQSAGDAEVAGATAAAAAVAASSFSSRGGPASSGAASSSSTSTAASGAQRSVSGGSVAAFTDDAAAAMTGGAGDEIIADASEAAACFHRSNSYGAETLSLAPDAQRRSSSLSHGGSQQQQQQRAALAVARYVVTVEALADPASAADPYVDDAPTGVNPFENSNNAVAAIAGDVLGALLCGALEMENGWRVWMSTLSALADRYRRDARPSASSEAATPMRTDHDRSGGMRARRASEVAALAASSAAPMPPSSEDVSEGCAFLLCLVLGRLARERVRMVQDTRLNVLRTLRLAESRLSGVPLARVVASALPVINLVRQVSKQQAQAAVAAAADRVTPGAPRQPVHSTSAAALASTSNSMSSTSSVALAAAQSAAAASILASMPADVRVEPLRGQEIWLVLELLVRVMPVLAGVAMPPRGWQETASLVPSPSSTSTSDTPLTVVVGSVVRPRRDVLSEVLSMLQEMIHEEVNVLLPDPDQMHASSSSGASSTAYMTSSSSGSGSHTPAHSSSYHDGREERGDAAAAEAASASALRAADASAATTSTGGMGAAPSFMNVMTVASTPARGGGAPSSSADSAGGDATSTRSGLAERSRSSLHLPAPSTPSAATAAGGGAAATAVASPAPVAGGGPSFGSTAHALSSSTFIPGRGARPGSGSRVDALMYVMCGLQRTINAATAVEIAAESEAALHHALTAAAAAAAPDTLIARPYSLTPAHASIRPSWGAGAQECHTLAIVLVLAMVNNSSWGAWEHVMAGYKDEAYMHGLGRSVLPPGRTQQQQQQQAPPLLLLVSDDHDPRASSSFPSENNGSSSSSSAASSSAQHASAAPHSRRTKHSRFATTAAMHDTAHGSSDSVAPLDSVTVNSARHSSVGAAPNAGADASLTDVALALSPPHAGMRQSSRGERGESGSGRFYFVPSSSSFTAATDDSAAPASGIRDAKKEEEEEEGEAGSRVRLDESEDAEDDANGQQRRTLSTPRRSTVVGSRSSSSSSSATYATTSSPPPPGERVQAVFDALSPALDDIRARMESSFFVHLLDALARARAAAAVSAAAHAANNNITTATAPAAAAPSVLRFAPGGAGTTPVATAALLQSALASMTGGGEHAIQWLRDLLIAEFKSPLPHGVTVLMDESPLRAFRRNAVVGEAMHLNRLTAEMSTRARQTHLHWTAVRVDLARAYRIALCGRAHRRAILSALAGNARSRAPSSTDSIPASISVAAGRKALLLGEAAPLDSEGDALEDAVAAAARDKTAQADSAAAAAAGASAPLSVLGPFKVDSHEDRSRARYRLQNAKGGILRAHTYAQYGKMAAASRGGPAGSAPLAPPPSSSTQPLRLNDGSTSSSSGGGGGSSAGGAPSSASAGAEEGDSVSRKLARAGAIKDVSSSSSVRLPGATGADPSAIDEVEDSEGEGDGARRHSISDDASEGRTPEASRRSSGVGSCGDDDEEDANSAAAAAAAAASSPSVAVADGGEMEEEYDDDEDVEPGDSASTAAAAARAHRHFLRDPDDVDAAIDEDAAEASEDDIDAAAAVAALSREASDDTRSEMGSVSTVAPTAGAATATTLQSSGAGGARLSRLRRRSRAGEDGGEAWATPSPTVGAAAGSTSGVLSAEASTSSASSRGSHVASSAGSPSLARVPSLTGSQRGAAPAGTASSNTSTGAGESASASSISTTRTGVVPEDISEMLSEHYGAAPGLLTVPRSQQQAAAAAAAGPSFLTASARQLSGVGGLDHLRGVSARASLVKPSGYAPGTLTLLGDTLHWTPRGTPAGGAAAAASAEGDAASSSHPPDRDAVAPPRRPRKWAVHTITALFLRCFRLSDSAIEVFVAPYGGPRKRRYFLAFEGGTAARDEMVGSIIKAMPRSLLDRLADGLKLRGGGAGGAPAGLDAGVNVGTGYGPSVYGYTTGHGIGYAYIQRPRPPPAGSGTGASTGFAHNYEYRFRLVTGELLTAWRSRRLSNFDYLMALNTLAGRSFNDLTQYPVMPWVLSDYTSPTLDLSSPSSFRDLARPMGAMTSERLREFRSRFASFDDDSIPKFLYGSHYSTAVGTVVHYLLRLNPFTRIHVAYQDGHFDVADRLFASVVDAWSMNTTNLSEVKELTPEWYTAPHFMLNHSRYDFGSLQDGSRLDSVRLPPWARGSHSGFVRTLRSAMESEWVSSQIHHWVDLVFGYKQRGPAAVSADNVFYYMTYAGGVDIDAIEDVRLRSATQSQITHYGQTPLQLLRMPHVPRGPFPTPPLSIASISALALPHSLHSAAISAVATGSLLEPVEDTHAHHHKDSAPPSSAMSRRASGLLLSATAPSAAPTGGASSGGVGALMRRMIVGAATASAKAVAVGLAGAANASLALTGVGGVAAAGGGSGAGGNAASVWVAAATALALVGVPGSGAARPLAGELRRFATLCGVTLAPNAPGGPALPAVMQLQAAAVAAAAQASMPLLSPSALRRQLSNGGRQGAGLLLASGSEGDTSTATAAAAATASSSALTATLAALPFTLRVNRSFSHIGTVPASGASFWRADSPSPHVPLSVALMFGTPSADGRSRAPADSVQAAALAAARRAAGAGDSGSSSSSSVDDGGIAPTDVVLSFGDLMCLGGAPPPATLSLSMSLSALASVVDTRGPQGDAWPRAPGDPYSRSGGGAAAAAAAAGVAPASSSASKPVSVPIPSQSQSSSSSSSKRHCSPKPFAFPVSYHLVCELSGYGSASTSSSSGRSSGGDVSVADPIASASSLSSNDHTHLSSSNSAPGGPGAGALPSPSFSSNPVGIGGSGGGVGTESPTATTFHVWWPIAPAGYVAMGCVVTAAAVVRIPIVSSAANNNVSSGGGAGSEPPVQQQQLQQQPPSVPHSPSATMSASIPSFAPGAAAAASAVPGGAVTAAAAAGESLLVSATAVEYVTRTRPVPPDPDVVVCAHISIVTHTPLDTTFVPLPWLALNIPPRPRAAQQIILRGWGAGAAKQRSTAVVAGTAGEGPSPLLSPTGTTKGSSSGGGGGSTARDEEEAVAAVSSPAPERGSGSSPDDTSNSVILRGWGGGGGGTGASKDAGSSSSSRAGVGFNSGAVLPPRRSISSSPGPDSHSGNNNGSSSSGNSSGSSSISAVVSMLEPEDEWVVVDDGLLSSPMADARGPSSHILPHSRIRDGGQLLDPDSDVTMPGPSSSPTSQTTGEDADEEEEGAERDTPRSTQQQPVDDATRAARSVLRVSKNRALTSRGVALYGVCNRAGTFVMPVPVSVQLLGPSSSPSPAAAPAPEKQQTQPAQFLVLASTSVPPVPEPSDATYHKAHTLCGAVAYEFAPAILSRVVLPRGNSSSSSSATTLSSSALPPLSSSSVASSERDVTAANAAASTTTVSAAVPFRDQHWTADWASTGAASFGAGSMASQSPGALHTLVECGAGIVDDGELVPVSDRFVGGNAAAASAAAGAASGGGGASLFAPATSPSGGVSSAAAVFAAAPSKSTAAAAAAADRLLDPAASAPLRPHIVSIRVLGSAGLVASAYRGIPTAASSSSAAAAAAASAAASGILPVALAAPPHTVLAVDTAGSVHRFRVVSVPTHDRRVLEGHLEELRDRVAHLMGFATAAQPPHTPGSDAAAASVPRASSVLCPRVRVRLIHEAPGASLGLVVSPDRASAALRGRGSGGSGGLGAPSGSGTARGAPGFGSGGGSYFARTSASHALDVALADNAPVVTLRNVAHAQRILLRRSDNGPPQSNSSSSDAPSPALVSFPVALGDLVCGGLVVSGAGFGRGVDLHAVDVRSSGSNAGAGGESGAGTLPSVAAASSSGGGTGSSGSSISGSSSGGGGAGLPLVLVPTGAKSSASTVMRRTLNSTVAGMAASLNTVASGGPVAAAGNCGAGASGIGGGNDGSGGGGLPTVGGGLGDLQIVGAASLTSASGDGYLAAAVTAVALEGDLLAVGAADGCVRIWRLSGMEGLSPLTALPGCRTRPDALLRCPAGGDAGAVLTIALSRDDDIAVVGYEGAAWVFEIARGRALQELRLPGCEAMAAAAAEQQQQQQEYSGAGTASLTVSSPACTGAAVTADGGIVVAASSFVEQGHGPLEGRNVAGFRAGSAGNSSSSGGGGGGSSVGILVLYSSAASASPLAPPRAVRTLSARITCVARLRGGGTGDTEGPGAVVAVGTADGHLDLFDGRDLTRLIGWTSPGCRAVMCVDVSPCTGYLVAGCAGGIVAVFALPALPSVLPCLVGVEDGDGGIASSSSGGRQGTSAAATAAATVPAPAVSGAPSSAPGGGRGSGLLSFFGRK